MRKHLLLIIGLSFALSSLMGQLSAWPTEANDDMPVIVNDSLMFIGQNVDSLTEEQRYFNPLYLIVQKGKEYLKKQLIRASVCDCDTTVPNRRIGIFSVAPNKHVSFSQGNLQYFPAANLWKFADNQYEYLGASNKYLSPTYRNWIDLFGWSSDSGKAPYGVSTSSNHADYAGEFVDWGTNWICGDPPSTWRTLSKQEWEYLIQERPMASSLYGMAQVIGINGIVLLPDKWLAPEGITFIPGGHTNDGIDYFSQHQSFSVEQWRLLEESGAVFLPAAGIITSPYNSITAIEEGAHYYTSNQYDEDNAYWFGFRSSYYTINYNKNHIRRSVRLVHDTIISFEPEYVDLGLSVKWATCNVGATKPEEYGDYYAWGENLPKDEYSWANYKWCDGTDQNITKYNTTDGLTNLLPEDDAAHVNWGEEWRMPTDKEWTELRENCIWTQTMQSGINGYKVTGINGNSIFLPAAGFHYANGLNYTNSHGDYWSSSCNAVNLKGALHIYFEPNSVNRSNSYRYYGFPIRPVYVDHTLSEPITPTSRIGVFSVSQNKQVSFAQGDLQYIQSEEKWRFADTQYEFTGKRHFQNGQLNDTIMYFGWSGKDSNAPWGISLSIEQKDYEGEFLDWGTNEISGYAPNNWRTISNDELNFLCKERKNAELLIGLGKIDDIGGLILLPDDWTLPQNLHFEPLTNDYTANQYTLQEWTEMENAGAIFLSMSGYFNHKLDNMRFVGSQGYIKTSTLLNERQVYALFESDNILFSYQGNNTGNLYYAFPVRLIRDTILPQHVPCKTFTVNGVSFNMMCVEGGTFTMGDGSAAQQVTVRDYMIGQTEVTRALWKAVMGSLPYNYTATDLPIARVTWNECQEFINQLNSLTGLYFRFPTKDEWLYAAKGGQYQEDFLYSGSNNIDEVGWYKDNSPGGIQSVAQLKPNALGIYDMTGNVWEWVAKNASESCMYLGGSYAFSAESCLLNKALGYGNDSTHTGSIGLRLVLDTIQPFEPEYVDLGLSVKWANYNLGASTPTEVGDYYAWGEIEPKDSYTTANYQWCKGSAKTFTKYCTIDSMGYNGFTDGLTTLQSQDDAAQMQKGGHWRMPSDTEWNELLKNCTWTQAEQGGQIGYIATSKINGNRIFIPIAGFRAGGNVILEYIGAYWSSTLNEAKQSCAYGLYINKDENRVGRYSNSSREYGFLIRPVYDENYHAYIDLGLSVMWATCNLGATKPEEYGDYFAWGETTPKEEYNTNTYQYYDQLTGQYTKYGSDNLTMLEPEDDAAHINWGSEWRMPTKEDMNELIDKCTWTWTQYNGIDGYEVTGTNGNSIFLPAAGYKGSGGPSYPAGEYGLYWLKNKLNVAHNYFTDCLFFKSETSIRVGHDGARRFGFTIRPILPTNREPLPSIEPSKRIGVFSVDKDKQVSFSQGNLQYIQSANLWLFADNQYDYIGEDNIKDGQLANKIDLFGWSGDSGKARFGVSTSTNNADYAGEFLDWGTNTIQGDTANIWRTLSKNEWNYLLKDRKNATSLRGIANINGINGLVILPDNWVCPNNIIFKSGFHSSKGIEFYADYQSFTEEQWIKLEESGAVFLPAAGMHDSQGIADIQLGGYYWSATDHEANYAYTLIYQSTGTYVTYDNRYDVRSVRLVHDTIPPPPAPCQTVTVNGVSFNMMCVEGGTFMMGAAEDDTTAEANEKPKHQVTLSDFMIGQTEVTQQLWEAVMGSNPSNFKGDNLPVNAVCWNECQAFITKLNALTGLHFRLPTEAEWEYAARGGKQSKGYKYAGSDSIDLVAWYEGNSNNTPHEVAAKMPNELGIYDMSGNMWEFCQDWYSSTYYTAEAQINPQGPASGTHNVDRGGSWYRSAFHCRITHRDSSRPVVNDYRLGLRLVLDKHAYVDLGLSVMWATCNVGATQPEEYGNYFAWGETLPKDEYSWTNYKWCDGTDQNITKYNTTDGLTTLQPEDDAAHINWGGEWRMPTGEEMKELYNFCTWERINTGEHKGYRLTSKINGNSIFLPAAGFKNELSHNAQEAGNDIWSSSISGTASAKCINFINSDSEHRYIYTSFSRFMGFSVRPVLPTNRDLSPNDDKVTITIYATPSDATVSLLCLGYTREGNSITVDKGKSVLYLVSNVADGYLSQGDSLLNLTRDTTLYINLEPFSDGIWETVDDSLLEYTPNCYISRNTCAFAKYDSWNYCVMPASEGEIYRIQTIAGQHAAPWIAVSTPPDFATLTRAKQIACSPIKGPAGYLAEEFVVPEGTNYVIINYRKSSTHPLIVEKKVTDIQPIDANSYTLVHGNDYNPLFCDSTDRASIMPYTIFIPMGVTIAPKPGYQWGYYTDVDTLNMPSGKLQYKWTTDSYVGEGKPVGITIKKDNGVFDFTSDSRYAQDYFYTSNPSIWIKSSSED